MKVTKELQTPKNSDSGASSIGGDTEVPPPPGNKFLTAATRPREVLKRVSDYTETVPKKWRGVVKKALSGKSKAAAIRAKCYSCCNYEDITNNVGHCQAYICALWPYRPTNFDKVDRNGQHLEEK